MDGRAGVLADTYRIPTQQPYQAAGAGAYVQPGSQPYDDGLKFEQDLQEVEGKTKAYYEKVAALKAFMLDMHRNRGIDVRVPDLAHPESIGLNQIYQRGLADIMHQGNLLKQGESERKMNMQRGDIYNPSSRGKADSEMRFGQDVMAKEIPANITQVNDLLQQPSFDDGDYQHKMDVYNSTKAYIQNKIKEDPDNATMYKHWESALTPPSRAIKQFAPQRQAYQDRVAGRKREAAGNILKEITNLKHGVADGYKISPTTTNPNNPSNPLMVKPNFRDARWNGKRIKEWGHDPTTDETFLFFDDGTSDDITRQNPMSIARVMMGENKATFGVDAEYMDEWADEKGYLSKDGELNEDKLLRNDAFEIKNENRSVLSKDKTSKQLKQLQDKLSGLEQEGAYWVGSNPRVEIKLNTSPTPAKIVKGSTTGRLHIDNFADIFSAGLRSTKKEEAAKWKGFKKLYGDEGVTAAEMKKFLQKYGAAQNLEGATVEAAKPATEVVQEKVENAKIVNPGGKKAY